MNSMRKLCWQVVCIIFKHNKKLIVINKRGIGMLKKIICGATLLLAAGYASAATITVSASVPLQTTNFDQVVSVDQFDDMGGTRDLQAVTFSLEGFLVGNARLESLDAGPSLVTTTLSVTLTLSETVTNNTLVITIPTLDEVFNATAFDGTIDFGGTSGITYDELTASQTESETYTDAATLDLFTGMGTIDLNLNALAESFASGAGNLITQFSTSAGGNIKVTYRYDDVPVTAPAHLALLGMSLLAFAGYRTARK